MPKEPIPTVRSFYRALTLRLGMFSDSILGRAQLLALARLLFEIGKYGSDVRELRIRLDLDPGFLSRLLHSAEKNGLVEIAAIESDRRSRHARLTKAGVEELSRLNLLGDQFAERTLERLGGSERERLVSAMWDVEKLLNRSFTNIYVEDPDSPDAKRCLAQLFAELGTRFAGGFDVGRLIPADAADLRPPRGTFMVARLDNRPVGCGAITGTAPGVGSIKRMWVSSDVRGSGIGRALLLSLEKEAIALGIGLVRLETNRSLREAHDLYRRCGYGEVEAFSQEPYADHWFEKRLEPSVA